MAVNVLNRGTYDGNCNEGDSFFEKWTNENLHQDKCGQIMKQSHPTYKSMKNVHGGADDKFLFRWSSSYFEGYTNEYFHWINADKRILFVSYFALGNANFAKLLLTPIVNER